MMARMLEAHAEGEESQWLSMKEWLQDMVRKWDTYHKHNVLWGMGILFIAAKILARVRAGKRYPKPEEKVGCTH